MSGYTAEVIEPGTGRLDEGEMGGSSHPLRLLTDQPVGAECSQEGSTALVVPFTKEFLNRGLHVSYEQLTPLAAGN